MMNRRTSNRSAYPALYAVYFLIGINVFVYTFRNDFRSHLSLHQTYRILDGNARSMIISMFYHMDQTHLVINMLALYKNGVELFHKSSSKRWRSFVLVIISYLVCGIFTFFGLEVLSKYHEYQLNQTVNKARFSNKCKHWICDTINEIWGDDVSSLFTDAWSDWITYVQFANVKLSILHFRLVRRIGASGVIYGWMGMRLLTSWLSPYHSKMDALDYLFFTGTLAHDLSMTPLTLDDLRISVFLEGDGIDHTAHFLGAIFGIFWAMFVLLWEKVTIVMYRSIFCSWQGQGHRLGDIRDYRNENLQRDEERRQRSRLIHSERTGSRNRGGRTSDRTML